MAQQLKPQPLKKLTRPVRASCLVTSRLAPNPLNTIVSAPTDATPQTHLSARLRGQGTAVREGIGVARNVESESAFQILFEVRIGSVGARASGSLVTCFEGIEDG